MAAAYAYYVRREFRLFGKRDWTVSTDSEELARAPDRERAIALATDEARRTAALGRSTEVLVNDGNGYFQLINFAPGKGVFEIEQAPEPGRDPADDPENW